jgi:predicted nucleic-acid-binding Zn-ribbon protein/peroxiredoxin
MTTDTATIAAGTRAPDATLKTADGTTLQLSSLWEARPLVLVFFGETASPFTHDNAAQLRDAHGGFETVGAGIVALAPGSQEAIDAFDAKWSLPYATLADGGARQAYGVSSSAVFVIDTAGVVRYARFAANLADYPPTTEVIAAVSSITGVELPPPPPSPVGAAMDASSLAPGNSGGAYTVFSCAKCGGSASERYEVSTAGGWISRIANFQRRKFIAVSCSACGYTDLYRARSGAAANIADLLIGG